MALPFKLSQELLQAASQLTLQARKNLFALLSGNYRSTLRGSGMQFKEFRHYEPGDDIRHMSWPVTARTRRATIKLYEEERELDVLLMVDASGSSLFGTGSKRKLDMYAELTALIGLAAIKSGDNFGLMIFTDKPGIFLPPKRSRNQILTALTHILNQPCTLEKSDIRPALSYAERVLKHRTLVLILSDFFLPAFEEDLIRLTRRHEVILLNCYDDAERGIGIRGIHEVWDPETDEFLLLDGNSLKTRNALGHFHTSLSDELEELSNKTKSDYLCLSVQDDYLQRLVRFFHMRGPVRL